MQTGMLHLHSILRYLLLIVAVWTLIRLAAGLSGKKPFTKSDKRPAMLFMILMDIQLLIGLYLYFFGGYGYNIIKNVPMAEIMKNSVNRFFAIEHITGMLVALILVHIGYDTTKKNIADGAKFKRAFWLFLIAVIVILAVVPWPFRDLGRGWMPGA